jgi:hypothetical protein
MKIQEIDNLIKNATNTKLKNKLVAIRGRLLHHMILTRKQGELLRKLNIN